MDEWYWLILEKEYSHNVLPKGRSNIIKVKENIGSKSVKIEGSYEKLKEYFERDEIKEKITPATKIYMSICFLFFFPVESKVYYFDIFNPIDKVERKYEKLKKYIKENIEEVKKDSRYQDKFYNRYSLIVDLFLNNKDEELKEFFTIIFEVEKDRKKEKQEEIFKKIESEDTKKIENQRKPKKTNKFNMFKIKKEWIKIYYSDLEKNDVKELFKSSNYLELYPKINTHSGLKILFEKLYFLDNMRKLVWEHKQLKEYKSKFISEIMYEKIIVFERNLSSEKIQHFFSELSHEVLKEFFSNKMANFIKKDNVEEIELKFRKNSISPEINECFEQTKIADVKKKIQGIEIKKEESQYDINLLHFLKKEKVGLEALGQIKILMVSVENLVEKIKDELDLALDLTLEEGKDNRDIYQRYFANLKSYHDSIGKEINKFNEINNIEEKMSEELVKARGEKKTETLLPSDFLKYYVTTLNNIITEKRYDINLIEIIKILLAVEESTKKDFLELDERINGLIKKYFQIRYCEEVYDIKRKVIELEKRYYFIREIDDWYKSMSSNIDNMGYINEKKSEMERSIEREMYIFEHSV